MHTLHVWIHGEFFPRFPDVQWMEYQMALSISCTALVIQCILVAFGFWLVSWALCPSTRVKLSGFRDPIYRHIYICRYIYIYIYIYISIYIYILGINVSLGGGPRPAATVCRFNPVIFDICIVLHFANGENKHALPSRLRRWVILMVSFLS